MKYKDRIKAARRHAGLTQAELGAAVGITQTSVSDLERGKSVSSPYNASIARACGVRAIWLEREDGDMLESTPSPAAGNEAFANPAKTGGVTEIECSIRTLSERLSARLIEVGITQEQLGQLVGISQAAVHKLVVGNSKTTRYIFKIAEVLGVSAGWLANGDGEMSDSALSIEDVQRNAEMGLLLKIVESIPKDERQALISYLQTRVKSLCPRK